LVATFTTGAVPLTVAPLSASHAGLSGLDQEMGPVPPTAVNVCEYDEPEAAEARGLEVVMVTGGFTVTESDCAGAAAPVASVAVTEKL